MEILAYLNQWQVFAGGELTVLASGCDSDIDVVRICGPDDMHPVTVCRVHKPEPIREQPFRTGSCFVAPNAEAVAWSTFAFNVWIYPTSPRGPRKQLIASHIHGRRGWRLCLNHDGRIVAEIGNGKTVHCLHSLTPTLARRWLWICLHVDLDSRAFALLYADGKDTLATVVAAPDTDFLAAPDAAFCLSTTQSNEQTGLSFGSFNGKLSEPSFSAPPSSFYSPTQTAVDRSIFDRHRLSWSLAHQGKDIQSSGEVAIRLIPVNAPRRMLTGPHWRPTAQLSNDRNLWNAVGLNEDAVDDLSWEPSARISLSPKTPSGVYAVRLIPNGRRDARPYYVPFFVTPRERRAQVAVVMSTFTYLAYANHRQSSDALFMGDYRSCSRKPVTLSAIDEYLAQRPPFGPSLYDKHHDNSEVIYSSRLRPVPQMQPDYRWWLTGEPRHFAADLKLIEWLTGQGIEFDVLTDEYLHQSNHRDLGAYRMLLTCSHPEYVSAAQLDTLEHYVAAGGNLAYLGGNGFYWKTEWNTAAPHRIEVRRSAEESRGLWTAPPGEHYLSGSAEPGGLWRDCGRSTNDLIGLTFNAQGWSDSTPYVMADGARDPRARFIFAGVNQERFGLSGINGGAVGDEWDAVSESDRPGATTLVLATSKGLHDNRHLAVDADRTGVGADMVLVLFGEGGFVFSVGSINFISALSDDSISAILLNVVRRAYDGKDLSRPILDTE